MTFTWSLWISLLLQLVKNSLHLVGNNSHVVHDKGNNGVQHVTALLSMRSNSRFPAVPPLIALNPLHTVSIWLFIFHCCGHLTAKIDEERKEAKVKELLFCQRHNSDVQDNFQCWSLVTLAARYHTQQDVKSSPRFLFGASNHIYPVQNTWLKASVFVK